MIAIDNGVPGAAEERHGSPHRMLLQLRAMAPRAMDWNDWLHLCALAASGELAAIRESDSAILCSAAPAVGQAVVQATSQQGVGTPSIFRRLVHVACAPTLYVLWFRKPLGVREPTVLPKELFREQLGIFLDSTRKIKPNSQDSSRLVGLLNV